MNVAGWGGTDLALTVAERLSRLLEHLGLDRVHIAGAVAGDWREFTAKYAERVASLSLVCPATGFDPNATSHIASRILVLHGQTAVCIDVFAPRGLVLRADAVIE